MSQNTDGERFKKRDYRMRVIQTHQAGLFQEITDQTNDESMTPDK